MALLCTIGTYHAEPLAALHLVSTENCLVMLQTASNHHAISHTLHTAAHLLRGKFMCHPQFNALPGSSRTVLFAQIYRGVDHRKFSPSSESDSAAGTCTEEYSSIFLVVMIRCIHSGLGLPLKDKVRQWRVLSLHYSALCIQCFLCCHSLVHIIALLPTASLLV